jgi:pathogenesis-related protein 1
MIYHFPQTACKYQVKPIYFIKQIRKLMHVICRITAVFFMGILPQFLSAQNQSTGSNISSADATSLLAHHNEVRKEVGVGPLRWSNDLAAYAQRWADYLAKSKRCDIRHRKNRENEGVNYGENLFWGSSATAYKVIDASVSWYGEKQDYQFSIFSNERGPVVGHYTQMVWRNTTEMGAGAAVCPGGEIIVVANYNPAGNFMGEYPY